MTEKYVVVYNREEIGRDTVKFVKRTRDTAKPFSYTKEEVEMLVGYGYTLIGHQLWYERHNKYSVGDLFVQSDGKQFVILDVRFPNGIGGMFYYDTHYVDNDKLVKIGDLGGMWGECVIDLAKFVGIRTDLLPKPRVKVIPSDIVSLFDNDDCELDTE